MASLPPSELTRLLAASRNGDTGALDRLMPVVYDELHRIAHRYLSNERGGHTLQTTALVHEAYMRLAGGATGYQDRAHFFAIAARTMRRILVDYANARLTTKRGSGALRVDLDEALAIGSQPDEQILAIDQAIRALEAQDERKARIVELIFFSGLSREEAAEAMNLSPATVFRELRMAKAWIHAYLTREASTP
ncbi:MAG: sigma-70 family RNA polymerase sigma factor [Bryobacterales bacterium]|nr:sigma-70 family RNA polymerase sigma factor [Bryobacterales bacterium]